MRSLPSSLLRTMPRKTNREKRRDRLLRAYHKLRKSRLQRVRRRTRQRQRTLRAAGYAEDSSQSSLSLALSSARSLSSGSDSSTDSSDSSSDSSIGSEYGGSTGSQTSEDLEEELLFMQVDEAVDGMPRVPVREHHVVVERPTDLAIRWSGRDPGNSVVVSEIRCQIKVVRNVPPIGRC